MPSCAHDPHAEHLERPCYDVGIEHLAFEVESRDDVDAAHERCLAHGARVHFPPQEDRDEEGYYAFFVFDPDGMRIEVFCWPQSVVTLAAQAAWGSGNSCLVCLSV